MKLEPIIDRNLLGLVLGTKDILTVHMNNKLNIGYSIGYIKSGNINIYELMHKCTEWAFMHGVTLMVYKGYTEWITSNEGSERVDRTYYVCKERGLYSKEYKADTPVEAVIKACQEIEKELNENNIIHN